MESYIPALTRRVFEEDLSFIYHSWLKSYRSSWAKGLNPSRYMDKDRYYNGQKLMISQCLERSVVLVAVNPEDAFQIFGYVVGEPGLVVHYLYVKEPFRRMGIATLLVDGLKKQCNWTPNDPIIATHGTSVFHDVIAEKYGVEYDPYLLMTGMTDICLQRA